MVFGKKLLTVLVSGAVLTGCAYPSHDGLLRDAHQSLYFYPKDIDTIVECVTVKFNNEPFGLMDINTPVSNSIKRGGGMQLVSSVNSLWFWSILLTQKDKGLDIHVDARKSVNPYLSNDYMSNKVDGYLRACGAEFVQRIADQ